MKEDSLLKINKAVVITTSDKQSPNFVNSIEKGFIGDMLNPVGIRNAVWLNCEGTTTGSEENRKNFLERVKNAVI